MTDEKKKIDVRKVCLDERQKIDVGFKRVRHENDYGRNNGSYRQ